MAEIVDLAGAIDLSKAFAECPHTSFNVLAHTNRINPEGNEFKAADRFLLYVQVQCKVCGRWFNFKDFMPEIPRGTPMEPNKCGRDGYVACLEMKPDENSLGKPAETTAPQIIKE